MGSNMEWLRNEKECDGKVSHLVYRSDPVIQQVAQSLHFSNCNRIRKSFNHH